MDKAFTHVGIVFTAVNNARQGVRSVLQDLGLLETQTSRSSRRIEKGFNKVLENTFGTDLLQAERRLIGFRKRFKQGYLDKLDSDFESFNQMTRKHMKTYTSMIMAGVALSMSGITMKRAGQGILSTIKGWTDAAADFGKVMSQIRFLGGVKNQDEFNKLRKQITKLGIELPVSNVDVANAALVAKKTGYTTNESMHLARSVSLLSFFSDGALDAAQSMKFLDSVMKKTGTDAKGTKTILDQMIKTMTVGPLDIGEMEKAWRSSRAGITNLGLEKDLPTFFALMTVARTSQNPRMAGHLLSQFGAASLNLMNTKGKVAKAAGAMGISPSQVANMDALSLMQKISDNSKSRYSNNKQRMAALKDMLGIAAMNLIIEFEKFNKLEGKSILQIRDAIKNSKNFSEEYLKSLKGTYWYAKEVLEGTKETFKTTMGDVFAPLMINISKALNFFTGVVTNLVEKHPEIAKALGYGTGLAGVLMAVGGTAMVAGGQILSMYGTMKDIGIQFALMNVQSIEDLHNIGRNALSVSGIFREKLLPQLKTASIMMLRVLGVAALLFLAWRFDFLKLRTVTTQFFNNFNGSLKQSLDYITKFKKGKLSGSGLKEITESLIGKGGWSEATGRFTQIRIFWQGLSQAIGNFRKTGKFTISKEMMSLLTGRDMNNLNGRINPKNKYMLELFTNMLIVIGNLDSMWRGFLEGIKSGYPVLKAFFKPFKTVLGLLKDISFGVLKLINTVFPAFADPNKNYFKSLGQALGTVLSTVMAIKLGILAWKTAGRGFIDALGFLGGGGGGGKGGSRKRGRSRFMDWLFSVDDRDRKFYRQARKGRGVTFLGYAMGGPLYERRGNSLRDRAYGRLFGSRRFGVGRDSAGRFERQVRPSTMGVVGGIGRISGFAVIAGAMLLSMLAQGDGNAYQNIKTNLSKVTREAASKFFEQFFTEVPKIADAFYKALIGAYDGWIAYLKSGKAPSWLNVVTGTYTSKQESEKERLRLEKARQRYKKDYFDPYYKDYNSTGWNAWRRGYAEMKMQGDTNLWALVQLQRDFKEKGITWDILNSRIKTLEGFVYTYTKSGAMDYVQSKITFDRDIEKAFGIEKDYMPSFKPEFNRHARGGYINHPMLSTLGEEGDEVVIPLRNNRSRAISLWNTAGRVLGASQGNSGGGSNVTEINFTEGAIKIDMKDTSPNEIKEAARKMFVEFKRLVELDQMRNYRPVRDR